MRSRPHYWKRTVDIEYWLNLQRRRVGELEGIANRTDFDLTTHSQHWHLSSSYFDQDDGEWYDLRHEPAARPVAHRR